MMSHRRTVYQATRSSAQLGKARWTEVRAACGTALANVVPVLNDPSQLLDPTFHGARREPFNATPMGVNSISFGSPHVRPMGAHRTRGEPNEIKIDMSRKMPTRQILPPLFAGRQNVAQPPGAGRHGGRVRQVVPRHGAHGAPVADVPRRRALHLAERRCTAGSRLL